MGTKKIVVYTVGGLCILVIGFVLFAYYQFTHNFRIPLSDEQVADMQTAFKGAMGEAIFSGQQLQAQAVAPEQLKGKNGLDALLTSTPPGNKTQGLIHAYQNDPQKFQRYAEMFDTATNARQVLDAVIRQGAPHPPRTSEPLALQAKLKVDAWGSPFCIIPAGERLAVVSGGPSSLSCDALPVNPEQMVDVIEKIRALNRHTQTQADTFTYFAPSGSSVSGLPVFAFLGFQTAARSSALSDAFRSLMLRVVRKPVKQGGSSFRRKARLTAIPYFLLGRLWTLPRLGSQSAGPPRDSMTRR
jgi:hypothetical protein